MELCDVYANEILPNPDKYPFGFISFHYLITNSNYLIEIDIFR